MLIAVNYHYIRESYDAPHRSIVGVTPDSFAAQLDELARVGRFTSQAELLDAAAGRTPLPAGTNWLITFDDGLAEQADLAWPILRSRGIPAIFFANTRPLADGSVSTVHQIHLVRSQVASADLRAMIARQADGELPEVPADRAAAQYPWDDADAAELKFLLNFLLDRQTVADVIRACFHELFGASAEQATSERLYMSPSQLRELAAAGCLGTHAHDHFPLARLSDAEIAAQFAESITILEQTTGVRPRSASYPYGSLDAVSPTVIHSARQAGLEIGFTVEPAANVDLAQPLALARFDCNDVPGGRSCRCPADEFAARVASAAWLR